MRKRLDIDAWSDAFIAVYESSGPSRHHDPEHSGAWAAEHFWMGTIQGEDAEECWQGILAVVRKRPSEYVLGMLAACPLEDLIAYSGHEFIKRIEAQAKIDSAFRETLKGAWQFTTPDAIWVRIVAARGEE